MATTEVPSPEAAVERDIDGVPLRDHKKLDIKAILGHAPEIEEDDEPEAEVVEHHVVSLLEASSEYDDDTSGGVEGDCLNCVVQRQRRSSLRTQHHDPPDSPTGERKAVRFADSLGIGLEAIRDLADQDEPPEIPHSAMTALRLRRKRNPLLGSRLHLEPSYPPPSVDDAFLARLDRRHVLLESSFVSSRELTVSGVVRVACAALEKAVSVRYTTDAWASHRDVPANYVPNSTDRFVFIVHLPEGFGEDTEEASSLPDRQGRVEFAVALHAGGDTFWDNNDGGNYVIDCVVRSRESSVSGEPKTPEDFEPSEGQTLGGAGQ